MVELEKLLRAREIDFHAFDRRIMCFPHVINICCQHVINDFTDLGLANSELVLEPATDAPNSSEQSESFEEAIKRDPIALGRNVVRVLRASGQRRDDFDKLVVNGNSSGWFKDSKTHQTVQLPERQLLHDVRVRWDSVFFMIERLREMRPVRRSRSL
jgi:hypothetical protein